MITDRAFVDDSKAEFQRRTRFGEVRHIERDPLLPVLRRGDVCFPEQAVAGPELIVTMSRIPVFEILSLVTGQLTVTALLVSSLPRFDHLFSCGVRHGEWTHRPVR